MVLTDCVMIRKRKRDVSLLQCFVNKCMVRFITVVVKFGEDKNCSERECLQLLNKHMPAHVTKSKVLQQLFIR